MEQWSNGRPDRLVVAVSNLPREQPQCLGALLLIEGCENLIQLHARHRERIAYKPRTSPG